MQLIRYCIALVSIVLSCGCYSYEVTINVKPTNSSLNGSIDSRNANAVSAVEEVAYTFGFKRSTNLAEVQKLAAENEGFTHLILAEYGRERDKDTNRARVLISVGTNKKTGELSVLVH